MTKVVKLDAGNHSIQNDSGEEIGKLTKNEESGEWDLILGGETVQSGTFREVLASAKEISANEEASGDELPDDDLPEGGDGDELPEGDEAKTEDKPKRTRNVDATWKVKLAEKAPEGRENSIWALTRSYLDDGEFHTANDVAAHVIASGFVQPKTGNKVSKGFVLSHLRHRLKKAHLIGEGIEVKPAAPKQEAEPETPAGGDEDELPE